MGLYRELKDDMDNTLKDFTASTRRLKQSLGGYISDTVEDVKWSIEDAKRLTPEEQREKWYQWLECEDMIKCFQRGVTPIKYADIEKYAAEQDSLCQKIERDIEAAEKAIAQNNQVWAMYKSAQKKSNTLIYVTGFLALVGVLSSSFILAAVGIVGLVASFIYSSKSLHLNDLETEAKKDSPEELLELHEQLKLQQGKKKDARELCRIKEEYEQLTKELNETNAFI